MVGNVDIAGVAGMTGMAMISADSGAQFDDYWSSFDNYSIRYPDNSLDFVVDEVLAVDTNSDIQTSETFDNPADEQANNVADCDNYLYISFDVVY